MSDRAESDEADELLSERFRRFGPRPADGSAHAGAG